VEVQVQDVDPTTGAAEDRSFRRMSRRTRCPVCGGYNQQFRRSYTAHVASVVAESGARRQDVFFVTSVLDRRAADRAGIDGDDSYQVLTGPRGRWTKARRAARRRDPSLRYMGTLTARPGDGRFHIHAVLVSRGLSPADLREAFHVAGLDVYVQQPRSNESAEAFAARKGAYAFDNTARSPSARFVSSRGGGTGYDSAEARERRRKAATDRQEDDRDDDSARVATPRAGAQSLSRNQRRQEASDPPDDSPNQPPDGPAEAASDGQTAERAPPVECDGGVVGSDKEWIRACRRSLMARIGTAVQVQGVGPGRLLSVRRCGDTGLVCEVHVRGTEQTADVRFRQIRRRSVPKVRRNLTAATRTTSPKSMQRNDESDDDRPDDDPVDRFEAEAHTSRVTVELPDGRRRVTIKNHRTGRVREKTLPPRS
jgi:hypothetical protein